MLQSHKLDSAFLCLSVSFPIVLVAPDGLSISGQTHTKCSQTYTYMISPTALKLSCPSLCVKISLYNNSLLSKHTHSHGVCLYLLLLSTIFPKASWENNTDKKEERRMSDGRWESKKKNELMGGNGSLWKFAHIRMTQTHSQIHKHKQQWQDLIRSWGYWGFGGVIWEEWETLRLPPLVNWIINHIPGCSHTHRRTHTQAHTTLIRWSRYSWGLDLKTTPPGLMVVWQWLTHTHAHHTKTQMHLYTATSHALDDTPNADITRKTYNMLFFSCDGTDGVLFFVLTCFYVHLWVINVTDTRISSKLCQSLLFTVTVKA